MSDIVTVRDIQTVTTEIKMIRQQVNQVALNGAIEIGRRLCEAKEMLPHGEWGRWLREEADFSQQTANNFMRLFDEYGDSQITMFGAVANSKTIGNLPYTKALKLLAVPEEEREAFAEEVDAENISVRELDRAIREREEAEERAAAAEDERDKAKKLLSGAEDRLRGAETAASAAKSRAEIAEKQAADLREKLEKADAAAKSAKEKLKKLKENPEIPADTMEKLRRDAMEEAAKEAAKQAEKDRAALLAAKDKAEQAAKEAAREAEKAAAKLDAVQKQLALANPDAAVFGTLFERIQDDWNRLHGAWLKASAADPALGEKLRAAARALIGKYAKEEW